MILDASFLIDLLGEDPGATAKLEEIAHRHLEVPTLAYTEVAVGLESMTSRQERFESVMEQVALTPYRFEDARRAVDIQRSLQQQGEPIGAVDAMIAGTAIVRDTAIVTRNVAEFRRTPVRVSPY